MSDNKNKPRKAELVKSTAGKVTRIEPPPARPGIFSRVTQLFYSPQRDKKRIDAVTEVFKSYTELGEARIELERTTDRFVDLDTILKNDRAQRQNDRLETLKKTLQLENEVAELAKTQQRTKRQEEIQRKEEELEIEERLAAIKVRRKRLQEAQNRVEKDEETLRREAVQKLIRRKLAGVYTVQELRAEEARLIAEVTRRYGGALAWIIHESRVQEGGHRPQDLWYQDVASSQDTQISEERWPHSVLSRSASSFNPVSSSTSRVAPSAAMPV
jgi:hypothetical protein